MKDKELNDKLTRTALYIRVSGEEQKIKGLSLEAQQERLETYAKERGWIITGVYIDAAKTARKNMHKRTEFQKMIESVKRNEVDILLFCRLDRWFRSVADYYKVMETLEAHNCAWKTTDEEYDTTTANGRLYINVKLSIAQNEADIDGERIDVVFDSKVQHGTVLSGSCPFWCRVNSEKRLELIPENVAILQDAFNYFEQSTSQRATVKYIRETYGVNWCYATFQRMLRDKLAIGVYDKNGRYNPEFCPAAISKEQFEHVQDLLSRNSRHNPAGRIYIFTGVLICHECSHALTGCLTTGLYYYKCNQHHQRGRCPHNRFVREDKIEAWLFENLEEEIEKYEVSWDVQASGKKRAAASVDRSVLRRKLTKLKELYMNDLIDLEEYKKDYESLTASLEKLNEMQDEPQRVDLSNVRKIVANDFREIYNSLTREEKRTLWKNILKEIRVDNTNTITGVSFF
ncbi:recombinase family protein [Blautia marasmi]|uniref:recombinase family protein n=1 Tax=Blautia marasmi TaxID=1917868 RepID=UPI0039A081E6